MTPAERRNPKILNGSRRLRIARGSGMTVTDVNQLVQRFDQAAKMMKTVARGGVPSMPGMGAIGGNRKPFTSAFEPSWHHTYSVHAWDLTEEASSNPLIYPELPQRRVGLVKAVFMLRTDPASARRFLADPAAYADGFALAPDEREALIAIQSDLNTDRLRDEFSLHALLTAGAATQLRLQRNRQP